MKLTLLLCGLLMFATAVVADDADKNSAALSDAVILIIRHAEKPDSGDGLSPAGQERAQAYVKYFKDFTLGSQPLALDYLFAAADSEGSRRPRLTLEPLSKATGLAIDSHFKDKEFQELADEIQTKPHGRHILICWHHGEIPQLMRALGANPDLLLPKAKWPADVFGLVIQLRYDANGRLMEARRIDENLMPGDPAKPASGAH